ncbi:hypothetical protein LJC34_03370 [Oscillospiraceae bacterium OttesenSCG-928-G22]|nr:hypothetical protein [Oscillospiraceae bacterium OttesenSCG-928-G22]
MDDDVVSKVQNTINLGATSHTTHTDFFADLKHNLWAARKRVFTYMHECFYVD